MGDLGSRTGVGIGHDRGGREVPGGRVRAPTQEEGTLCLEWGCRVGVSAGSMQRLHLGRCPVGPASPVSGPVPIPGHSGREGTGQREAEGPADPGIWRKPVRAGSVGMSGLGESVYMGVLSRGLGFNPRAGSGTQLACLGQGAETEGGKLVRR